ncbi:hypothetical protein LCM17_09680 [Cereibacter sphaeroides]|nr:hypothetical protein [Cereibacter sphaeroides]
MLGIIRTAFVTATLSLAVALPAIAQENDGDLRRPASPLRETQAGATGGDVLFYSIAVDAAGNRVGRIGSVQVAPVAGYTGAYQVTVVGRRNLHRRCTYVGSVAERVAGVATAGVVVINAAAGTNNALYVTTTNMDGVRTDLPFNLQIMCIR